VKVTSNVPFRIEQLQLEFGIRQSGYSPLEWQYASWWRGHERSVQEQGSQDVTGLIENRENRPV
jgi:hypothetical protein